MSAQDEEHDRLLDGGSPSLVSLTKRQGSGSLRPWQYLPIFTLAASVAFTAGYLLVAGNDVFPFRLNSTLGLNANGANVWEDAMEGTSPLFNASFADYLTSGMKARLAKHNGTDRGQYVYDSPFEKRWPGSEQPYWARKTIPFNRHITSGMQICFVHLGKAGGSTMGCLLGFSLHCDSDNDIKGLLPIVTMHAFHRGVDDCADDAAYYLFVVRDPLARMLSDFNYERPDMTEDEPFSEKFWTKELYYDCNFWTLDDLAQKGLLNTKNDELSKECQSRAVEAITGVGKYLTHGYFNYQYYSQFVFKTEDNEGASTIPENANLIVIRNNHMVDDFNRINQFIGGHPNALQPSDIPVNNAHVKNSTELYLSESSKIELCRVLCNEVQVYKDIIKRAKNFNDDDVLETMKELHQTCPREAEESKCFEDRPDIHRKVEYRRGEWK